MTRLPASRPEVRRDLAWLAALAALLFLLFLGARDLWNPNEPTYGRAVVEMAERGDWLLPRVNGEAFAEKPILYFFLARAAGALSGTIDEFTLRLPSAASGIAGVLLIYLLVLPYAGRFRARIAGALFATTYIVLWSARSVQMDLLLAVCALAAILAATRVLDHGSSPWRGYALSGAATGLAVLAKGPVGLIVVALPVLAHAVVTRRAKQFAHPALLAGVGTFLMVSVPWFAYLWVTGEREFLVELLYRQNVVRSLEAWDHGQPWWYFLREFWNDMAPWSLFVPLAVGLRGRDEDQRRLDGLALGWIAVVILFFSVPLSKRSPYILPVAPAVAILVSGLAERLILGELGRLRRRVCLALIGVLGALFATGGFWALGEGLSRFLFVGRPGEATGLLLGAGGVAVVATLFHSRREIVAPWTLGGLLFSLYLLVCGWLLPTVDTVKSPRAFCEGVNSKVAANEPLRSYGMWKWRAGYLYYTGRKIPRLETPEQLARYWHDTTPAYLLVEHDRRQEVLQLAGATPLLSAVVGSKIVYLFGKEGSGLTFQHSQGADDRIDNVEM